MHTLSLSVDTRLFYFFIFEYIWQVVADLIFSNLHKSFITSSIQITFVSNASKHNTIKTSLIKQYGYENNTLYKKFLLLQYSCSVQMITCFCYLENIFQVIERRAPIKHIQWHPNKRSLKTRTVCSERQSTCSR